MKTLLTFSFIIGAFLSFAQTNVISSKDHGLGTSNILSEPDNFGGPEILPDSYPSLKYGLRKFVDTIEYIGDGCVLEYYTGLKVFGDTTPAELFRDTVCGLGTTGTVTIQLKNRYGENVVFIGFKEETHTNYLFNGMRRSGITSLIPIFLLFLFILNKRKFKPLTLFILFFSATQLHAQTNVISSKDHSLGTDNILLETDNFGEPPHDDFVDTLEYIGNNQFVIHRKTKYYHSEDILYAYNDTITDKENNGVLTEKYYRLYGDITYINFKEPIKRKEFERSLKKNGGFPIIIGLFIGIILFFFIQKNRKIA